MADECLFSTTNPNIKIYNNNYNIKTNNKDANNNNNNREIISMY